MAKKLTTEDLVLNIIVNSNPAQSEIGKLSRVIQDNKSKLQSAQQEMKKLEKQKATSSSRYRELQGEVTKYNSVISESRNRLTALNQTLSLEDKNLKQLESSLRRTRELWRSATSDAARRKYADEIDTINKRIGQLKQGTSQVGDIMSGFATKFTNVAGLIATASALVMKTFNSNLRMEPINQALLVSSGNAENFNTNLEFLRNTSERLGLEFISTATAFKQWQGAAKFSNLTAYESREIFESVANAGAKMKLSNEQVEGTFLALSQMLSKGKVQAEELRGQLGERLPGAFSLAAKAMGVTEQELNKMLEKGEVIADEFLPRFAAQLDKSFGNNQTEKIEGMQASVNRLSNEFDALWQSERASGFFTSVLDGLARMFKDINIMVNSKSWDEFKAAFNGQAEHAKFIQSQKPAHIKAVDGFSELKKAEQELKIQQMIANVKSRSAEYNAKKDNENLERLTLANATLSEMYKIYYSQHEIKKKINNLDSDDDKDKAARKAEQARRKAHQKEIIEAEKQYQALLQKEGLFREDLSELTKEELEKLAQHEADYQTKIDAIQKKYVENLKTISQTAEKELKRRADAERKYIDSILIAKQTEAEAERLAFDDRLKKAGLYGLDREKLTERQLQALEILERQHKGNLAKIDADAIAKEIDARTNNNRDAITDLRIQHAEELAEIRTLAQAKEMLSSTMSDKELSQVRSLGQARKLIMNQQQLEEQTLLRQQLNGLLETLRKAQDSGQFEGVGLADSILSDEEKKVLEDRIRQIREELAKLTGVDKTDELGDKDPRKKVDILGMSIEDWENMFANVGTTQEKLEGMYGALEAVGQIWSQYNQLVANKENAQLQKDEAANNKKKENLQRRLDSGAISQEQYNKQVEKLDKDLDKKKAVVARNQAKRERNVALMSSIVNTAKAVTSVLPNLILAGIVGAFGGLQIATISSTPLPEIPGAQSGGQFLEVTRSQDGKRFKAKSDPAKRGYVENPTVLVGENGREWVANADAVANPTVKPILDVLDVAQKNGTINTLNLSELIGSTLGSGRIAGRRNGGSFSESNNPTQVITISDPQLIKTLEKLDNRLSNLKAEVTLLGKKGFIEQMDEYQNIKSNSSF